MAAKNGEIKKAGSEDGVNRKVSLIAGRGIRTEKDVDNAISAVFSDLASGVADHDQSRLLLSSIGKKLTLENLKLRAGFYKAGKGRFFLTEAS